MAKLSRIVLFLSLLSNMGFAQSQTPSTEFTCKHIYFEDFDPESGEIGPHYVQLEVTQVDGLLNFKLVDTKLKSKPASIEKIDLTSLALSEEVYVSNGYKCEVFKAADQQICAGLDASPNGDELVELSDTESCLSQGDTVFSLICNNAASDFAMFRHTVQPAGSDRFPYTLDLLTAKFNKFDEFEVCE